MTDDELRRLLEVCSRATHVVAWYAHPEEVRGPFGRWFRCEGPLDAQDGRQRQGSRQEDIAFCAAAMNNFPGLISEVLKLRRALLDCEMDMGHAPGCDDDETGMPDFCAKCRALDALSATDAAQEEVGE